MVINSNQFIPPGLAVISYRTLLLHDLKSVFFEHSNQFSEFHLPSLDCLAVTIPDCTNGTSRMGRVPMPMIHYDVGFSFTSRSAHPTLAEYFQKQIEAALALRIAKRKPGPRKRKVAWDKQDFLL
jgi:hypothetical protein